MFRYQITLARPDAPTLEWKAKSALPLDTFHDKLAAILDARGVRYSVLATWKIPEPAWQDVIGDLRHG